MSSICLYVKNNCDGQIFISFVFPQFISSSFYVSFLSRVKINSINWPAPNIWVFIAQLVGHCSANTEAMGSNPVEALKYFSGLNLQLPKLRLRLVKFLFHLYFRISYHLHSTWVCCLTKKQYFVSQSVSPMIIFLQLVGHVSDEP